MKDCTDKNLGNLLHAYEIGILSEPECEQFETHLLGCEHCHGMLESFEERASLLATSEKVKAIVGETVRRKINEEPFITRIWNLIWPKAPLMLRPAVAYILVLLMIIPAYQGLMRSSGEQIESLQTVRLLPGRSTADNALKASSGNNGLLSFVFRGAIAGESYRVMIVTEHDEVIFRDDAFKGFDEYETGRLLLPIAKLAPGIYRLVITDPRAADPIGTREYTFRIEY
jgi:hypothetical protein